MTGIGAIPPMDVLIGRARWWWRAKSGCLLSPPRMFNKLPWCILRFVPCRAGLMGVCVGVLCE